MFGRKGVKVNGKSITKRGGLHNINQHGNSETDEMDRRNRVQLVVLENCIY